MTLLLTALAAVFATVVWYLSPKARLLKVHVLCYLFWGASLMWLVDAIAEYMELGAAYFTPDAVDMLNDTFLGLSVIVFGFIIWIVYVLLKDPLSVIRNARERS